MFKLYKKADILEKISDKVKTVDDLLNLPLTEFDRECCDYWFNDYLGSKEYRDRGYYPCVTPVLDDFDIGLIIDALDVYLEKLETENNLCASRDIRLVAILKQQLEGLVSCEDVQIVER